MLVLISNLTLSRAVASVTVQLKNAHLLLSVMFKSTVTPQLIAGSDPPSKNQFGFAKSEVILAPAPPAESFA